MQKLKLHLGKVELGIWYMLLSVIVAVIGNAFVKAPLAKLPVIEIVFFTNLIGSIFMIFWIIKKPLSKMPGGKPFKLFLRAFLGYLGFVVFYYLIKYIPLGNAITFDQSTSLFATVFAFFLLKEKLLWYQILALIVGFIGLLFVVQPDGFSIDIYNFLGICEAVIIGYVFMILRELRKYYSARFIVLYYTVLGMILPGISMMLANFIHLESMGFLFAKFQMPNFNQIIFLILLGLLMALHQVFKTKAFALSKTGVVGTISYSQIVFGIFIGVALGDSLPDMFTIFGICLIIFSGIVVAYKKKGN